MKVKVKNIAAARAETSEQEIMKSANLHAQAFMNQLKQAIRRRKSC